MGERGKASCAWAEKEGTLQNSKILQCARGENWLFAGGAGVEFRVKGVEILAVQVVLGDAQRLAEPLEVDDFPFPQELDGVPYVRVVRQAEDVVIGNAGLLLWCNHESATWG